MENFFFGKEIDVFVSNFVNFFYAYFSLLYIDYHIFKKLNMYIFASW